MQILRHTKVPVPYLINLNNISVTDEDSTFSQLTLQEGAFNLAYINRRIDALPAIHDNVRPDHRMVAGATVHLHHHAARPARQVVERLPAVGRHVVVQAGGVVVAVLRQLHPLQVGLEAGLRIRIRIRIQSGQWIRIREGKNDPQKLKFF
jgi:hypothetical protein